MLPLWHTMLAAARETKITKKCTHIPYTFWYPALSVRSAFANIGNNDCNVINFATLHRHMNSFKLWAICALANHEQARRVQIAYANMECEVTIAGNSSYTIAS